jgi:hypothetical protein
MCYKHVNPSDSPRHRGRDGACPVSTEGHGDHTNPVRGNKPLFLISKLTASGIALLKKECPLSIRLKGFQP